MKIFKQRRHALFNRPLQVGGQHLLSVGVFLYFDLDNPDALGTEQDLWTEVPAQLGKPGILDHGWPKDVGEVLVFGTCHQPHEQTGGQPHGACTVSVTVGTVHKQLSIFGNRYWQTGPDGLPTISDPEPFSTMPVDWEHAFGGTAYPENPRGKGADKVQAPDGRMLKPLPNVEAEPLLASPDDRPEPAGLGMLEVDWPRRRDLSGTYDEAWKRERWPGFPDNLNPQFFQSAPQNQRLESGFWQGGEAIEVMHMHPKDERITSQVPTQRVRVFLTRRVPTKDDPQGLEPSNAQFFEISMRAETVVLLPGIRRGVLMFRGTAPMNDDESSDIARLMVVDEAADDTPGTLEHYRDEQLALADKGVPDTSVIAKEFERRAAKGIRTVKNLPKTLKKATAKFTKDTSHPPKPHCTPQEHLALHRHTIAGARANLDHMEAVAKGLQQRFPGHVNVPHETLARLRSTVNAMEGRVNDQEGKLAKAFASAKKQLEAGAARLDGGGPAKEAAAAKLRAMADSIGKPQPVSPLHDWGYPYLKRARLDLLHGAIGLRELKQAGIERDTASANWLGTLDESITYTDENGVATTLGPGVVGGFFAAHELVGLACRAAIADDPATDSTIPAAGVPTRLLESARSDAPLVVAADWLDALFVEQEAGDFVHVCWEPLPKDAKALLKAGAREFRLVPADAPPPHSGERVDWPAGACSVLQARKDGYDARAELLKHMPRDVAREHSLLVPDEEGGEPPTAAEAGERFKQILDPEGIKKQITGAIGQTISAKRSEVDQLLAKHDPEFARFRQAAAARGKAVPDLKGGQRPALSTSQHFDAMADKMQASRDQLLASKGETDATRPALAKMDKAVATMRAKGKEVEARLGPGTMGKSGPPPPGKELSDKLAAAGVPAEKLQKPDAAGAAKGLQSEQGLENTTLKGLSFDGQDLSGMRAQMVVFSKCSFKGAVLDKARLKHVVFSDCDLSGASLREVSCELTVLKKCMLDKAMFDGSHMKLCQFQKCTGKDVSLAGALLEQFNAGTCTLPSLVLAGAQVRLCGLDKSILTGLDASGARLEKSVLKKCALDDASFVGIQTDATLLHGCTGQRVRFDGSHLHKLRINHACTLPGLRLTDCRMTECYAKGSDLSGASFAGVRGEGCIFTDVNFTRANLRAAVLKRSRLNKCDLSGADMAGMDLYCGSLRKSRLVGTDLSQANCFGVDFYKCTVGRTSFDQTNLKRSLLAEGREKLIHADE